MPSRNIFITGGTGKIGRFLIRRLRDKGYNISLLCKREVGEFRDSKTRFIQGDLLEPSSYASGLKEIDTVLHMAGVTHTNDTGRYYRVNSEATLQLVEMCKRYNVKRFLFISTRAISEEGGHYSRSKLIAEKHIRESGLNWIILRLAEVYGISGNKGMDAILNGIRRFPVIPIIGNGEYRVNPVYIQDVIFSIMKAIEKTDIKNKIYTIAGPASFTYNEFIDKVLEMRHLKKIKVHIPLYVFRICLKVSAAVLKDNFLAMDQLPRLISEKSDDISPAVKDFCFQPAVFESVMKKNEF